jgi:hypothetical protein
MAKPLTHIGFLSEDHGEMGCCQGGSEKSMVKVAPASDLILCSTTSLAKTLNYIPDLT